MAACEEAKEDGQDKIGPKKDVRFVTHATVKKRVLEDQTSQDVQALREALDESIDELDCLEFPEEMPIRLATASIAQ